MLQRMVDAMRRVRAVVVMVLMAILVVVVVTSVFFRYVLLAPLSWTEEFTRYLMIWLGFLAASIAVRDRAHVGVDFLVHWSPPRLAIWLRRAARVFSGAFFLIVTVYGFLYVFNLWDQESAVLQIRMVWPYLAIPVGGLLMFIELVMPSRREAEIAGTY